MENVKLSKYALTQTMRSDAILRNAELHQYALTQEMQLEEVTKDVFVIKNALTSKVLRCTTRRTGLVTVRAKVEVDVAMALIGQPEGPCGPILRRKVLDRRLKMRPTSMFV
jgi:hypothetical protein